MVEAVLARERLCWERMSVVSGIVGDEPVVSSVPIGAILLLAWGAMESVAGSMVLARGSLGWKKTSEVSGSVGVGALEFPAISPGFL